jgi:hypothetical protein
MLLQEPQRLSWLLQPLAVWVAFGAHCCWQGELQWRLRKPYLEIVILRGSLYSLCK